MSRTDSCAALSVAGRVDRPLANVATRNPFVSKLAAVGGLSPDDVALLDAAATPARHVAPCRDLIREGDRPGPVLLVLDGWACRYKVLSDGSRQIMAFLMPEDFCDLHAGVLDAMDHSIGTLTDCRIVTMPRDRMDALIVASPALTRPFWRTQLVDQGVLRAWIVSIGRRDAVQRVAHLMLELHARLSAVGLARDQRCPLPLTQIIIADALGLTPVHINRVLRTLRERGAMTLSQGTLTIRDADALARIAGFDGNYLHRRLPAAV